MTIRGALIQAIAGMTERQALDLVQTLGQWADNQRNYIDESDPQEVTASEKAQLAKLTCRCQRVVWYLPFLA